MCRVGSGVGGGGSGAGMRVHLRHRATHTAPTTAQTLQCLGHGSRVPSTQAKRSRIWDAGQGGAGLEGAAVGVVAQLQDQRPQGSQLAPARSHPHRCLGPGPALLECLAPQFDGSRTWQSLPGGACGERMQKMRQQGQPSACGPAGLRRQRQAASCRGRRHVQHVAAAAQDGGGRAGTPEWSFCLNLSKMSRRMEIWGWKCGRPINQ